MRYFLAGDGRGHEAGGGQTITPPLSLVALSKPSLEGGRAMRGDDARRRAVAPLARDGRGERSGSHAHRTGMYGYAERGQPPRSHGMPARVEWSHASGRRPKREPVRTMSRSATLFRVM